MSCMGTIEDGLDLQRTSPTRYFGKYRGLVTDNDDPRSLARVRARVPEVLGEVETGWALPCAPYSGDGSGVFTVPEPGAGVWIEFEAGDVSRPIWSGCWWGSGKLPTSNSGSQAAPALRILRSEEGLMISFDDDGQKIHVSDKNGQNMLEIEAQSGIVRMKAKTKAIVEAPLIDLVENGTHPVVFGDSLLQYLSQIVTMFNSHMHPGQTCAVGPVVPTPPVPPFPVPTPSLLSSKVKAG